MCLSSTTKPSSKSYSFSPNLESSESFSSSFFTPFLAGAFFEAAPFLLPALAPGSFFSIIILALVPPAGAFLVTYFLTGLALLVIGSSKSKYY